MDGFLRMRPCVYTQNNTRVYVVSSKCACALQLHVSLLRRFHAKLVLIRLLLFVVFACVSFTFTCNSIDNP